MDFRWNLFLTVSVFIALFCCEQCYSLVRIGYHRRFETADEFPYTCTVQYKWEDKGKSHWDPVSGCTILSEFWVLTSSDNLNLKVLRKDARLKYYQRRNQLEVYAGIYQLYLTGDEKVKEEWRKRTQFRRVEKIVFSKNPNSMYTDKKWEAPEHYAVTNPVNYNLSAIEFCRNGRMGFNIALVKVYDAWQWSKTVLPVLIYDIDLSGHHANTEYFIRRLEKRPFSKSPCYATGFGLSKNDGMVTQLVVYVPYDACRSAYCSHDMDNCLNYPMMWYQVCFKSLHYTDTCRLDEGSPLMCPWFDMAVIAILSGTENCGIDGLPGVYTLLAATHKFHYAAVRENLKERPSRKNYPLTTPSPVR